MILPLDLGDVREHAAAEEFLAWQAVEAKINELIEAYNSHGHRFEYNGNGGSGATYPPNPPRER